MQIPSANDVPAGTYTLTITDGLKNPVSVDRIDNAEKLTIRTMLSDSGKGVWSSIDQANLGSSYRAVPGEIDAGTMVPTPPAENAALGVAAAQVVDTTYAPNQLLDFKFVPKHSVPRGGFLKVRYPPGTFEFNSAATAVAQFAVKASGSDKNVANILQVFNNDQKDPLCTVNGVEGGVGCVIGVVSDADGLKAGAEYYIRLAGLRNPRHVIDYDKMDAKNIAYWEVRTYDSGEKPDDTKNLIDVGVGGTRPIKTVAEIATFNVEPLNTTNGANGSYFITWYSEIVAKDGDVLAVPFPAETSFHPPTKGTKRLDCVATVGTLTLACTFRADQKDEKDPDVALVNGKNTGWKYGPEEITQEAGYAKSPSTYNVLEMTLKGVTTRTGLYKVKVDAVTNPRSRRGSSAFGRVTHTTATGAEIQEYRVKPIYKAGSTTEFQLNSADEITYTTPPVSVATEAGSELQYVNTVNITQHSELYGKKTVYEIRYRAYSVVRAVNGNGAKLKLALSYPK